MRSGWLRHQHRSHRLWHLTFYFGAVVVAFLVLKRLAPILSPILAAMGMAYLLDPLVEKLHRRGVPRAAAVTMILLGFLMVLTLAVAILIPLVATDVRRFAVKVPELFDRLASWIEVTFGVAVPHTWHDVVARAGEQLKKLAGTAAGPILRSLAVMVGSVFSFLLHMFELLLIPVFAFYFLLDWPNILASIKSVIPPRHRVDVQAIAGEIDEKISHWVRGQLIVVSILAVLYAIALSVVGIQLAVPVGILSGLLTFIPYVGTAVGLALAAMMALLDWHGFGPVAGVLITFGLLHALESFFLTPVLVGKKVGLGEAGALFAVLAGAELLGFVGVMLAVPLAAAVAVLVRRAIRYYSRSEFFTYGTAVPEEAPEPEPEPEQPTATAR